MSCWMMSFWFHILYDNNKVPFYMSSKSLLTDIQKKKSLCLLILTCVWYHYYVHFLSPIGWHSGSKTPQICDCKLPIKRRNPTKQTDAFSMKMQHTIPFNTFQNRCIRENHYSAKHRTEQSVTWNWEWGESSKHV